MKSTTFYLLAEASQSKINKIVQTVKSNSFSANAKTDTITNGTLAIDALSDMAVEVHAFDNFVTTTVPYDDTDAINTNAIVPVNADIDGIANDLTEDIAALEKVFNDNTIAQISSDDNRDFTKTSTYNTAQADLLTALADLKTAIYTV